MLSSLILFTLGLGAFLKYDQTKNPPQANNQWKQEVENQLISDQEALAEVGGNNANMEMYYEREIALNEYRIQHNVAPQTDYHIWSFITDAQNLIFLAGIFTIVIAASIVSSEFTWGTVKLLLIRPLSRSKILLSKYLTVLLFCLVQLAMVYILSSLVGLILFGLPSSDMPHLAFNNGEVVEQNIVIYLIGQYFLSSIDIVMSATLAFMISAVFRNSSLAISLSLFLLFMGGTVTMLLASRFEWAKYFLFANTDLSVYFDGVPPIEGMTLTFSIIMLVVYFVIFHVLAFGIFRKRDIAA